MAPPDAEGWSAGHTGIIPEDAFIFANVDIGEGDGASYGNVGRRRRRSRQVVVVVVVGRRRSSKGRSS